jgi:two-component system cell cycle sensor histidine kinase PleC
MNLEIFGAHTQKKYKEYAKDIHASGEHLLALITDILDISMIEAGKVTLDKKALRIDEIATECISIVTNEARAKGVKLRTEVSSELPPFFADRRATRQILLNLLANAVKFTPEGGSVTLLARETGNNMVVTIADTGSGIPAEMLPKLTEPFTRLEQQPHNTVEGWGLGLSISNALIELHDGKMDIESTVGKGTTVRVTFPIIAS